MPRRLTGGALKLLFVRNASAYYVSLHSPSPIFPAGSRASLPQRTLMHLNRGGLAVVAIVLCFQSAPQAFSSLEFFGGAYHERITHQALEPLKITDETLHWLDLGNLEADKFYGDLFGVKPLHFTDMTFEESEDVLEDRLEDVVELMGLAVVDYQMYRRAMVEYGTYLHAVQDFYSHTNWVEKHLVAGVTTIPLAPSDFDDFPFPLVSPYTLARTLPPGEVKEVEPFEKKFRRPFYRSEELDSLDDRQRIRTAAEPKKAFIHYDLAKDNPAYTAGRARWNPDGPSVFEFAVEAATRETTRQWQMLESEIAAEHKRDAPRILRVLRDGWLSSFPDTQEPATLVLTQGHMDLRRDLTLRVDFVLTPTVWNRRAAQEAIKVYNGLTRPKDQKDRYKNEGVTELHLLRDDAKKEFRLSYRADLYGSARGGARLQPLEADAVNGPWELLLSLPEGLSSVDHFLFRPHTSAAMGEGAATQGIGPEIDLARAFSRKKELRIVLAAPRSGWKPPSWLREYLRDDDL